MTFNERFLDGKFEYAARDSSRCFGALNNRHIKDVDFQKAYGIKVFSKEKGFQIWKPFLLFA